MQGHWILRRRVPIRAAQQSHSPRSRATLAGRADWHIDVPAPAHGPPERPTIGKACWASAGACLCPRVSCKGAQPDPHRPGSFGPGAERSHASRFPARVPEQAPAGVALRLAGAYGNQRRVKENGGGSPSHAGVPRPWGARIVAATTLGFIACGLPHAVSATDPLPWVGSVLGNAAAEVIVVDGRSHIFTLRDRRTVCFHRARDGVAGLARSACLYSRHPWSALPALGALLGCSLARIAVGVSSISAFQSSGGSLVSDTDSGPAPLLLRESHG